ncbi:MAG: hypothetical protein B7Y43_03575 [Sphingomonas sp. 28-62-20]|uniref:Abi-alpha family protein n=1 Tax=Sphingomonas sp. 28-62-20 TaxID=1970433 RepID=UPI000BD2D008|nr:MAG: hypothetical protein B7Y43_03575 [Sphingomonas sp. 28-62-20]
MPLDIEAIVKPLTDLAEPVVGTISDTWQAVIGDRIAVWRLMNALNLQKKVSEQLLSNGLIINSTQIPERYAFAWFEKATEQDEPEIQELFARLLARAAEGDADAIDRRHIDTLASFTPTDAVVMKKFYEHGCDRPRQMFDDEEIDPQIEMDETHFHFSIKKEMGSINAWKAIEHLLVLGVIERSFEPHQDTLSTAFSRGKSGYGTLWPNKLNFTLYAKLSATANGWSLHRALD